jgi:archaellum component FlaF (FlaF/FlaG flagellin family)
MKIVLFVLLLVVLSFMGCAMTPEQRQSVTEAFQRYDQQQYLREQQRIEVIKAMTSQNRTQNVRIQASCHTDQFGNTVCW